MKARQIGTENNGERGSSDGNRDKSFRSTEQEDGGSSKEVDMLKQVGWSN